MGAKELSALLWEERNLLDLLLFKLEQESLVLDSGRHQLLGRATSEVEFVLSRLTELETQREAQATVLAADFGLDAISNLEGLADAVPEPWSGTFREHRNAIRSILARIQEVAQRNRQVLTRYVMAVSDALQIVSGAAADPASTGYRRDGEVAAGSGRLRLVDARG